MVTQWTDLVKLTLAAWLYTDCGLYAVYCVQTHFFLEPPTQSRALKRSLDDSWEQRPLSPIFTLAGRFCSVSYCHSVPEALNTFRVLESLQNYKRPISLPKSPSPSRIPDQSGQDLWGKTQTAINSTVPQMTPVVTQVTQSYADFKGEKVGPTERQHRTNTHQWGCLVTEYCFLKFCLNH